MFEETGFTRMHEVPGDIRSTSIPHHDENHYTLIPTTKCEAVVLTGISNFGVHSPTIIARLACDAGFVARALTWGRGRTLTAVVSLLTNLRTPGIDQLPVRMKVCPGCYTFVLSFFWGGSSSDLD